MARLRLQALNNRKRLRFKRAGARPAQVGGSNPLCSTSPRCRKYCGACGDLTSALRCRMSAIGVALGRFAGLAQLETKLHRAAPRSNARMSRRLEVDDEIGQPALNHVEDASDCITGDGVDERIGPAEAAGGGYDIVHCEESIGRVGRHSEDQMG
jgi:hypothetical protein